MRQTMSLTDIGRYIRTLTDQHDALDAATAQHSAGADALDQEMSDLLDQVAELERRALRRRAASLSDGLAQAAVCFHVIERIVNSAADGATTRVELERALHAHASIITRLETFLGIEVDSLSWAGTRDACAAELAKVGGISETDAPGTGARDIAAEGVDAALIATCEELLRASCALDARVAMFRRSDQKRSASRVAEADAAITALAERITGTPVATPEGLSAVARVTYSMLTRDSEGLPWFQAPGAKLALHVASLVAAGVGRA